MVEAKDIRKLDISVEDGLKMILSAGVINPLESDQLQFEYFHTENDTKDEDKQTKN